MGFCCKFIPYLPEHDVKQLNATSTTIAWLNRQPRDRAYERLLEIAHHNCEAYTRVFEIMHTWPVHLRQIRLGSEMLPAYTEPTWRHFWQLPDVRKTWEQDLAKLGARAREYDIRLSQHPGQFVCMASEREDVVTRSIEEFEYHVDVAKAMGYGSTWHDHGYKINIHVSGRQGPQGMLAALNKLSPEARNLITLENDEITWGIDAVLQLADQVAVVLDLHHHYIYTGEYIQANDDRIKKVIDSWRGVRPIIHYSASREDVLIGHSIIDRPNLNTLLASGYKKSKLRAHSDFMWNKALNEWAYEHWQWADVMVEAKRKNLASFELYKFWKSMENSMSSVLKSETNTSPYA
jgi:UV DNA damage repair endonuclease